MVAPIIIAAGLLAVGTGVMGYRYASRVLKNPAFRKNLQGMFSNKAEAYAPNGSKWIEGTFHAEMDRKEAAEILNIPENATDQEIKAAHRKLMQINHPDNGGSTYLSTKINEAKEALLKGRDKRQKI